jgi:hypothetical protein
MKHLFLILTAWCFGMQFAKAQTATDKNQGLRLTAGSTSGTQALTWWGKSGRTFFIQQSFDLINWTYLPTVLSGPGTVDGMNFTCTDSRQFWRLRFTDVPTGSLTAGAADSDGDGLSNYDEITLYHTDPLNPDSDGDGILDSDEVDFNLNKTGNDMVLSAPALQYDSVNRLIQTTTTGTTNAVGYDQEGNITNLQ